MSTNKAPLTLISTAETVGVLVHLEIWGAEQWILMHRGVLWELSGFRKGNEFKQRVDLCEYLLHVEKELPSAGQSQCRRGGEGRRNWTLALKSRSQSSSIVFLTVAVFYSFSVWLLAPSISLCFTFRFISVHALSAEPLVLVPSPHSLTLDPPQVPWMGLWRSWWSHTEDTGPLSKQAYRKC